MSTVRALGPVRFSLVSDVSATEARIVDRLNAFALQRLGSGPTCAPAYLGLFGPLLFGADDAQVTRAMRSLGLEGVTRDEMLSAIASLIKRTPTFTAVWSRPDFQVRPEFAAAVEGKLDTSVERATADVLSQRVDSWSFGATHGRIRGLAPAGAFAKAGFFSASAFACDPQWVTAFEKAVPAPFKKRNGQTVSVPMMRGMVECKACATADYKAAKIPLDGGMSFVMVVPNEGVSLEKVAKDLASVSSSRGMLSRMRATTGEVRVPRIEVSARRAARDVLSAELRGPYGLVGSSPVTLDNAVEAWVLNMDEHGLSAGSGIGASFAKADALVEGNRAFIYMLREEATGLFLATGIYDGQG